jgi:hypothetical protein
MEAILQEIKEELVRQREKWGEQNHPFHDQTLLNRKGGCSPKRMCSNYEIPSETRARQLYDTAAKRGEVTWMHILQEEVSEACSEFNEEALKKELIQIAAVCVSAVESIERGL